MRAVAAVPRLMAGCEAHQGGLSAIWRLNSYVTSHWQDRAAVGFRDSSTLPNQLDDWRRMVTTAEGFGGLRVIVSGRRRCGLRVVGRRALLQSDAGHSGRTNSTAITAAASASVTLSR
jgi:hypothetical protein